MIIASFRVINGEGIPLFFIEMICHISTSKAIPRTGGSTATKTERANNFAAPGFAASALAGATGFASAGFDLALSFPDSGGETASAGAFMKVSLTAFMTAPIQVVKL
jgi:hypothetical protein